MNSGFSKNVLTLLSGSVVAQIIVVVCAPFMTRIFSVEAIGLYSLIIAFASIFTAVLNGRYDMGIVSENDDSLFALLAGSSLVGIFVSLFSAVCFAVYMYCFQLEYSIGVEAVALFCVLMLAMAANNVLTSYNNRVGEYKIISAVYVVRNSIQNILPLLLGLVSGSYLCLFVPYVLGQLAGLGWQARSLLRVRHRFEEARGNVSRTLKKDYRYPLYSAPAMLANSFSYSSVTLVIEALFSIAAVGFYTMSTRILGLPISLVGGNIAKVFYREASVEFGETGSFRGSVRSSLKLLVPIALVALIVMIVFAPPLCALFFGEEWSVAGEYIQILAPMFSAQLVCTALSPALLVREKQNLELLIQMLLVATTFVSLGVTLLAGISIELFLASICVTKTCVYLFEIIIVWRYSK